MADLENMLLEAAGRTTSPVRKRHKLRHSRSNAAFSDDGSDSGEEDSDKGVVAASKKPPKCATNVPLKKRLGTTTTTTTTTTNSNSSKEHGNKKGGSKLDGEGGAVRKDDHDGGSSSDESDVGSDLYKNEEDRKRLAKMTELEREMILSERATRKGDKEFKAKMRMKRENNNNNNNANAKTSSSQPSSAKVRSSARHAKRTAAKGGALNELRTKRMKQQILEETHVKLEGTASSSKGMKQKSEITESPSSSNESVMRSDSEGESSDDGGLADSDDDKDIDESEKPTFEDIKEITITRSRLVKWLNEPFFEELIVGCFVRIGIGRSESGPVYRLCMVQKVDCGELNKHYKVENRVTHKYLVCVWGSESSAKRFQVAVVSDSSPLEKEFRQWVREVERTCSHMPSKVNILEKKEAIRKTNMFIYSAATVKQMLEEKKSATSRPLNVAVEKDRLKREWEIAKSKNNKEDMDRITSKIAELESSRDAREKDAKAIRLAEMNKKNRVENFKILSKHRQMNANLKAGEEGYDPFSRRWTRSRNYYNSDQVKECKEEKDETVGEVSRVQEGDQKLVTTKVGVEATKAALQAAANAGKLIDTAAPVDGGTELNVLHDFDLLISLTELQDYGGPHGLRNAFLLRKQKIEATVGSRVPQNDGSRHVLTLTISDYKRRRGLL